MIRAVLALTLRAGCAVRFAIAWFNFDWTLRSHRIRFVAGCGAVASCNVSLYSLGMIRSFRHKGLERYFRTGSASGIQIKHAKRLRLQLFALNRARNPHDMNVPGWKLHPLQGALAGHWSVWVSSHWRLTFTLADGDAELVDYQDYH
jgi:proteic killer suppression protein